MKSRFWENFTSTISTRHMIEKLVGFWIFWVIWYVETTGKFPKTIFLSKNWPWKSWKIVVFFWSIPCSSFFCKFVKANKNDIKRPFQDIWFGQMDLIEIRQALEAIFSKNDLLFLFRVPLHPQRAPLSGKRLSHRS